MVAETNWARLGRAVDFYQACGFRRVEVPWFVAPEITALTLTDRGRALTVEPEGDLIGSAEQSLLTLDRAGQLGQGRFVACTPCFRREPVQDDLHLTGFMKVELYRNDAADEAAMQEMIGAALTFMRLETKTWVIEVKQTGEGFDLELGGIEVGSYGYQQAEGLSWTYGTGIAEPRFTQALTRFRSRTGE